MTSSALFFLQHEAYSAVRHSLAHPVGFMTNNCEHVLWRNYLDRSCDDMRQQRLPAYFMKNLWMLGFQPCAFSRCHDCDGGAGSAVGMTDLGGGHSTQYTATVALPSLRVEGANQLRHESGPSVCSTLPPRGCVGGLVRFGSVVRRRRLRSQFQQISRNLVSGMARHVALFQIVTQNRAHSQGLNGFQIGNNLGSAFEGILGFHFRRSRRAIDQRVIEDSRHLGMMVKSANMVRRRQP